MPEAGPGIAQTVRVFAGGTAGREANRVGARTGVDGGVPEVAGDGGEYRTARKISGVESVGMERSDGARGGCVSGSGTRAANGGVEWQVIRELSG